MPIKLTRDDRSTPTMIVDSTGLIRSANRAAQDMWGAVAGSPCMSTVGARDDRGRAVCHDGCPRGRPSRATRWPAVQSRGMVGALHCSSMGSDVVVVLERPAAAPAALGRLTAREREVLSLIAAGLTTREAAVDLGIQHSTARTHLERCRGKLRARSMAQAIARAVATHQIELP